MDCPSFLLTPLCSLLAVGLLSCMSRSVLVISGCLISSSLGLVSSATSTGSVMLGALPSTLVGRHWHTYGFWYSTQLLFSKPYHQAIPPGRTQDHIAFQFFPEPTWDHCHNFLTRQSLFLHTPYLWPSYHGATSALLVSCRPVAQ